MTLICGENKSKTQLIASINGSRRLLMTKKFRVHFYEFRCCRYHKLLNAVRDRCLTFYDKNLSKYCWLVNVYTFGYLALI